MSPVVRGLHRPKKSSDTYRVRQSMPPPSAKLSQDIRPVNRDSQARKQSVEGIRFSSTVK